MPGTCALVCSRCVALLPPLQGHSEIIWAIELSGDRVYTASADKTVRVWDLNTKRCVQVRPSRVWARDWGSPAKGWGHRSAG